MATVYLAVQESLNREVVLKTVNSVLGEQSDFLERFINEGRIVASLTHPHIITIYDIGVAEELIWIAMEFVEGGDLKARIRRHLSVDQTLGITLKIAQALEFAHARDIVHRDVKPANILFRPDNTPLLSDFGIAKQVTIDLELTSTGTILGSPFYMSPEQAEGRAVDGRTDLYSLGVIFYEMLTGDRPYNGDTAVKVIMQHIQSPVPHLPDEFKDFQPLLSKLMAKDREARFPGALELIRDVRLLQEKRSAVVGNRSTSSPATARTMEDALLSSTPPGKRRGKRLALLVGCLALVGGGWFALYAYSESLRNSTLSERYAHASEELAGNGDVPSLESILGAPGANDTKRGAIATEDMVQALHWLGTYSIRANRLTQPPADNAYYYFSRLLDLDPENDAAKKGFASIAERFVVLAEEQFNSRNYGKARSYIALGLQVQPDNEGLKTLQSFIDNREQSLLDKIFQYFRSSD